MQSLNKNGLTIMNLLEKFKQFINNKDDYKEVKQIDFSVDDSEYLTFIYKDNTETIKERYSHIEENNSFQVFFKQSY